MIKDVSDIIRECAKKYIIPRYKNLKDDDVKSKTSPRDLVTIADIEAEYYLQEQIPKAVSNAVVIGEESISRGEYTRADINDLTDETLFVVDPVDGTGNFVRGSEKFAVMVAMVKDRQCLGAWIYDPINDLMTTAQKGQGAYTNETRIKVSNYTSTSDLSGYASLRYMKTEMKQHFQSNAGDVQLLDSIACAAHMYLDVAHGRQDFTIFTRLKPWDHLPGILICQEAGGFALNWDSTPYTIDTQHTGIICTNGENTWNSLHSMFISSL